VQIERFEEFSNLSYNIEIIVGGTTPIYLMRIILLKDLKNLGKTGDIKDVAEGYAINYLIPQGIALKATDLNVKKAEEEKERNKMAVEEKINQFMEKAKSIEGKTYKISAKAKGKKLFGSIGKKEIAEKLGFGISEDMIELDGNIKETGQKNININFGNNIKAAINLKIEGE